MCSESCWWKRLRKTKKKQYIIETNLDDFDPELWPGIEGKFFEAGALDVWRTALFMKKGRQGLCLSLLCAADNVESLQQMLLTETTAIGCRTYAIDKTELEREQVVFTFEGHSLSLKRVYWQQQPLKYKVEYEQLAKLSKQLGEPLVRLQRRVTGYLEEQERWKHL